jgi:hypothetical protein
LTNTLLLEIAAHRLIDIFFDDWFVEHGRPCQQVGDVVADVVCDAVWHRAVGEYVSEVIGGVICNNQGTSEGTFIKAQIEILIVFHINAKHSAAGRMSSQQASIIVWLRLLTRQVKIR